MSGAASFGRSPTTTNPSVAEQVARRYYLRHQGGDRNRRANARKPVSCGPAARRRATGRDSTCHHRPSSTGEDGDLALAVQDRYGLSDVVVAAGTPVGPPPFAGALSPADLAGHGVYADISGVLLDGQGRAARTPVAQRIIGITANQLTAVPKLIAIAHAPTRSPPSTPPSPAATSTPSSLICTGSQRSH